MNRKLTRREKDGEKNTLLLTAKRINNMNKNFSL